MVKNHEEEQEVQVVLCVDIKSVAFVISSDLSVTLFVLINLICSNSKKQPIDTSIMLKLSYNVWAAKLKFEANRNRLKRLVIFEVVNQFNKNLKQFAMNLCFFK